MHLELGFKMQTYLATQSTVGFFFSVAVGGVSSLYDRMRAFLSVSVFTSDSVGLRVRTTFSGPQN